MFGCGTSLHNCEVFSIWDPVGSHLGAKCRACYPSSGFEVEAEKVKRARELKIMLMKLL